MPDINPYDAILVPIPERSEDALTGSAFAQSILNLPLGQKREDAMLAQLEQGNVPAFMRLLSEVNIKVGDDTLTLFVLPDYLCVGSDDDYFRTPLNPLTAQKVADLYNCILPTRKIVNEIWKASTKLNPKPLPPGAKMTTTQYFIEHDRIVNADLQKKGILPGTLVGGHKKDVVICKSLPQYIRNVVIYGWHQSNGVAIQGQNATSHDNHYADYSHGIRLVCKAGLLNGSSVNVVELLKTDRKGLVSDEGPLTLVRYPA